MKTHIFISLIVTPVMFLLATTSAMLLPGTRASWNAIAIAQSQESAGKEDSSEAYAKNNCDDNELVNCGEVN